MRAGGHLDDERLSALMDGEAEPTDVAHARSCAECSARVEAWRQAVRLVAAAPVDPPAGVREATIEAALGAVAPAHADAVDDGPERAPLGPPAGRDRHHRRRRLISHYRPGLAAAAALLIVVGGVSAAVALEGGGSSNKAASGASSASTASGATGTSATSAGSGLGSFSGTGPLASRLRSIVSSPAQAAPFASNSASVSGSASAAPVAATAPTTPTCPSRAAAAANATTPAIYHAALTYRGDAALVYVFAVDGRDVAVVERSADCATLADFAL